MDGQPGERIASLETSKKTFENQISELFDYRNESDRRITKTEGNVEELGNMVKDLGKTMKDGVKEMRGWFFASLIGSGGIVAIVIIVLKVVFHF